MGIRMKLPTLGTLCIVNAYLHPGSEHAQDRKSSMDVRPKCIARHTHQTTIVLTGDFNFAEIKEDRIHIKIMEEAGHRDTNESRYIGNVSCNPATSRWYINRTPCTSPF